MEPVAQKFVMGCWITLIVVWLIAAVSAKKTLTTGPRWAGSGMRLAVIVVLLIIVRLSGASDRLGALRRVLSAHFPSLAGLGMLLSGAGVALAVWARLHLGRNWGMPMSLRQGHELVTSGPYAYVRHPIYSAIMLLMLGSALASGAGWLLALVVFGAYFFFSARTEERDMIARFPEAYPAYRRRTRMLIPFVL